MNLVDKFNFRVAEYESLTITDTILYQRNSFFFLHDTRDAAKRHDMLQF